MSEIFRNKGGVPSLARWWLLGGDSIEDFGDGDTFNFRGTSAKIAQQLSMRFRIHCASGVVLSKMNTASKMTSVA